MPSRRRSASAHRDDAPRLVLVGALAKLARRRRRRLPGVAGLRHGRQPALGRSRRSRRHLQQQPRQQLRAEDPLLTVDHDRPEVALLTRLLL
eukprot:2726136-Prymnesium_polylepis.1